MRLYEYDDVKKLNQALASFAQNGVDVENVNVATVENKVKYFVLANPKFVPQPKKVESKTEDDAKKNLKEKKEDKVEVKAAEEVKPAVEAKSDAKVN